MFDWFSTGNDGAGAAGMEKMRAEFGRMLSAGRHAFDAAANALLGGTDIDVIREDVLATDRRINEAEQQIRREIVVHASVHGATVFPSCLVLMSVVKDAERLGDYAKNILELAGILKELPAGVVKEDLIQLKNRISQLIGACDEAFNSQDVEVATQQVELAGAMQKHCDAQVEVILRHEIETEQPAGFVLAYRYFKRMTSHTRNVLTSIVQPIDKLDFAPRKSD